MQLAFIKMLIATLVLVWFYKDGSFYVTADSREVKLESGTKTYDNKACKLLTIGHVLFFDTGYPTLLIDKRVIVSGEAIARKLLTGRRSDLISKQEVDSIADSWALGMKNGIERYLTDYPLAQRPPGGTNGVFIASLADGSTYGTIRQLKLGDGSQVSINASGIAQGFVGVGDYDGNRIANRRLQDARSHNILQDSE